MKEIKVNGSVMEVSGEVETIGQLMEDLELKSTIIIVEHNQVVLQKEEVQQTQIVTGDTLGFVQFVGGG